MNNRNLLVFFSYVGIPVKIIRGVSKCAGYRPGMTLTKDTRFRNAWTAVLVDEQWRFVDSHWGARHVSTTRDGALKSSSYCYEVDELFFLTDPEQHIMMHFPDEPKWQLLKHPLSIDEFEATPLIKSHFIHYDLAFVGQPTAVLQTDTGQMDVVLLMKDTPLAFKARLEFDEVNLDSQVVHQIQGNQVIFSVNLPCTGDFFLTIFASDTDKTDSFNNVCTFKLRCTNFEQKGFFKFPPLPDGYGLTPIGERLGFKADKFKNYKMTVDEEKLILNVKFDVHVKVSHKLLSNSLDKDYDLERVVFERFRDKTSVSYLIRFPASGTYVFSIFAAEQKSETDKLGCACRYLLQCSVWPTGAVRYFPRAQSHWQLARLHEPTCGDLRLNKNVKFKIEATGAEAVAVIINNQWFYLKKAGKVWEGVAFTGKDAAAAAEIYARYGSDTRDFYPLLEYKLIKENFIDPCMEIK